MIAPVQAPCVYCGREMWLAGLEPCCDKPEHAGRMVCADVRGCVGVVLARLHDQPAGGPAGTSAEARQLAQVRLVLDAYDPATDDAHFALEQVGEVLGQGGTS